MSISAKLSVSIVVRNDDKFAVVRENQDGKTVINFPSGHIEPGETLVEAACRELLEETGISCERFYPISSYLLNGQKGKNLYVSYLFEADRKFCVCRDSQRTDEDVLELLWLTKEEILAMKEMWRNNLIEQKMLDVLSNIRSVFHFS